MNRIALLDPATPERLEQMRSFLPPGWRLINAASREPADQITAIAGSDFVIVSDVPVTAEMLAVPGLKAVHKWGVGYDSIDLEAARTSGVRVLRTTGANAITVAETTLGLALAVNRNLVRGHVGVMQGAWLKGELAATSATLSGKTVGIVGMGYIGKALAGLLRGFGCRILYYKRTPLTPDDEAMIGATFAPLEQLLTGSDVVTLNCELNASTRNMINRDRLACMKPDAILVNAARGGVVVEADLAEALRSGRLRGAGVDVFSIEPIRADNPLLGLDNVVLTPHVAALSSDGFPLSVQRMLANLIAIAEGREPQVIDILV